MGANSTGNNSRKAKRRRYATPLADLATGVLAPIVARRASMSVELLAAWPDIVGPAYGSLTRPEKIKWPRRASETEPFEPGVLVLAVDPRVALQLQHESGQVLQKVNLFFGFPAVSRLQIRQKPVTAARPPERKPVAELSPGQADRLSRILRDIGDSRLRASLEKLGRGVMSRKSRQDGRG